MYAFRKRYNDGVNDEISIFQDLAVSRYIGHNELARSCYFHNHHLALRVVIRMQYMFLIHFLQLRTLICSHIAHQDGNGFFLLIKQLQFLTGIHSRNGK